MLFLENIMMAFTSLFINKMRALLTMLGIIIGIGSVIAIVTVGNSLTNSITTSMESMGANNITVGIQQRSAKQETTASGMTFRGPNRMNTPDDEDLITLEQIQALQDRFPEEIKDVSIQDDLGSGKVTVGRNYANINLTGVNQGYFLANSLTLKAGGEFKKKAYDKAKGVCLVSDQFVDNNFNGEYDAAIGREVEVELTGRAYKYYTFTIVGVYEYEATGFDSSSTYDVSTSMYIPLATALEKDHAAGFQNFTVITATGVDPEDFMTQIKRFMNRFYHNNDDYSITTRSMSSVVSSMTEMISTVSLAIEVIAAISLLVGGIGVMNIMLVSISERTREIGTRKALGATNGSIRMQFIMESIVICLVGGAIGIALGIGGGAIGAKALGYEASPSITSIVASLAFSMVIGVFFGYYPANKAAKMNPIDALRYE